MANPTLRVFLLSIALVSIWFGFAPQSPSDGGFIGISASYALTDDPGCTNEDCPPDPGCTNEDCPPDPGCTNEDCPPAYWAGCCCHEEDNLITERTERLCCCNEGNDNNVSCRWSFVTDPDAPLHERISDILVAMDPALDSAGGLCTPRWFTVYVGDAWGPMSEACGWWSRLTKCRLGIVIDIKPGSSHNCLNVNGHGIIPVAINGSQHFNVLEVDLSSLRFASLAVKVKNNGIPQCGYEDWNGDGYDDVVCHFLDDPAAWAPGTGEATLVGQLTDGTPIEGSDTICVVP